MAEKRLSHAYMLVGPDTPERQASVTRLAAELLCPAADGPCMECRDCRKVFAGLHPDVINVERQPGDKGQLHREILVDQIRQAAADAVVAPNEAERKVYVIREADHMNVPAQNALLKALEDPPDMPASFSAPRRRTRCCPRCGPAACGWTRRSGRRSFPPCRIWPGAFWSRPRRRTRRR